MMNVFDVIKATTPRVTLNWSPMSEIIWTKGSKLLQFIDPDDEFYKCIDDITVTMRERAEKKYGFDKSFKVQDEKLSSMWEWLEIAQSVESQSINNWNLKLIGVSTVFSSKKPQSKTEMSMATWLDHISLTTKIPCFKSIERDYALRLCNWAKVADEPYSSSSLIRKLEKSGQFSRAAAICIFQMRLKKAIDILMKGSNLPKAKGGDSSLNTVAMALSGYTSDKTSLWRKMCSTMKSELTHPYLKAIFSFLTSDSDMYEDILFDRDLKLSDRIAFACTYLSDNLLKEYLEEITNIMKRSGQINGLLLTGVSDDAIDLLECYVERTCDVQSVSLVLLYSLPQKFHMHIRAQQWVENYRDILNRFKLWHERAEFDQEWYKRLSPYSNPEPQIFVRCYFCNHNICPTGLKSERFPLKGKMKSPKQQPSGIASQVEEVRGRVQNCPTCLKALARCSLCLCQLGTATNLYGKVFTSNPYGKKEAKVNNLCKWFAWCQSCCHGGHADHVHEWFKENTKCSVSNCDCECMKHDFL